MSFIVFENDGEIDERSIRTFGVSVKETKNPIGFFGTGLKYAIAILLRTNQSIEILSGTTRHEFKRKIVDIRKKEFELITMNDVELPFTTELGKTWELWQAFREIYCNALDEKGAIYKTDLLPVAREGKTFVIIKGQDFEKLFDQRGSIVLNVPASLLLADGACQVYNQPSQYLYYRGVRVAVLDKSSLFTYNITEETKLTEDRTILFIRQALSKPALGISNMTDTHLITKALTCGTEYFESGIIYDDWNFSGVKPTTEFMEIAAREFHLNNDRLNPTARDFIGKQLKNKGPKHFVEEVLTGVQKIQLEKCKDILTKLYPDFSDYPILVVKNLGQCTFALVDKDARRMILSKKCFDMGTKFLMSTMLEEYAHLVTGYGDETRELQTWLFDQICTLVENYIINEPI